ncbi:RHS repeat-associated core domain-containing protein [Pragia fontium]|uniref:RHS repeat-associated core domain-containing protein n=1 Tax=Pragia fontium TaxID=82985 RepID=UPI00069B772D|nr:RHS repeat-associated core domain-containing protein [Pragia fontium]
MIINTLTDPRGLETLFAYDGAGNRIYQRDAKNNETHYSYNMRGQLHSQSDCSGNVTRFIYDDFGQLSAVQNALQQTDHFKLSPGGKLLQRIFANGSTRQYHYDTSGLLSQIDEDDELRTRYHYNARGQMTEQRSNGKTLRLEYDNYGRLSALYNEKGEPYRFHYNVLDELTEEVRLDGTRRRLTYDPLGSLIKESLLGNEGGQRQTTLLRDKIGRLVLKERADYRTEYDYQASELHIRHIRQCDYQAALSENRLPDYQILSFIFDEMGQLTGECNHHGQYHYEYDELGNLVKTAFPDQSELQHFYYGSGHLLQSKFTHGAQQYLLAEYTRDNLHREISRTQGTLTELTEYDAMGRITAKLCRAGTTGHHFHAKVARHYHYNRQNQLQTMKLTSGQGENFFDYGEMKTTDYHYDEAGQVVARYTDRELETFSYDAAGNLLNNTPVAWNNQIGYAGDFRYDYDEFGRMQQRISQRTGVEQHFHYDSDNRVTSVEFTRHHRYKRVCYDYDALGRRTAKTLTFTNPHEADRRTEFYWQGMRLCGERTSNQALSYYFYHEGSYTPLARFDCNEADGDGEADSGDLLFMHAEANGMPLLLSDQQGNTVWQQTKSGLFGRVKREESTLSPYAAKQNLRFSGQYYDEETGLHYNTFRYYDPECGRFTQPDPIGLLGGINLYQYAPNPLSWIDPFGLSNAKNSTKPQHGYYIRDTWNGDVPVKVGVSGQDMNLNGTSPRANGQVNRWNAEPGNTIFNSDGTVKDSRYRATIETMVPEGQVLVKIYWRGK